MATKLRRAFTLIELLVVIAIIAILAAILFPVLSSARESAKDVTNLSNVKQIGLSMMMYSTDHDDYLPLAVNYDPGNNNNGLPWTWQQYIQPYAKNFDVFQDVKMPGPTSTVRAFREFQISQHMGVPVIATAVLNGGPSNVNPYLETGPSWAPIVGSTAVRFDGMFGVGVSGNPGGYMGLRYMASGGAPNKVPSRSTSTLENVSDQVMAAYAANYDMWFGNGRVVGGQATWCNSGYGTCVDPNNCGIAWSGTVNITGPHARKRPVDGTGNYRGSCLFPNGQAVFAAADGSAKSMNLRRVYEIRQLSDGTRVFYRFWPAGGTN